MKKMGMILILSGISLIAALSMEVGKENRNIGFMRLFSTVSTVLVIAGVSATVLDNKPD